MVDKLKAYLAELVAKKEAVLAEDKTDEINVKTVEFRDSLVKAYEVEKADAVAKIDSDINCIECIIAREVETVTHTEDAVNVEQAD